MEFWTSPFSRDPASDATAILLGRESGGNTSRRDHEESDLSRRLLIGAALLVALGVAALLLVATSGLLELRGVLAARLSAATGREVTIAGTARLRPTLPPGLRVEGVAVGEPADGSWLRGARIGRLELVLALWPLVRGEVRVHGLELHDVALVLEAPAAQDEAAAPGKAGERRVLVKQARATDVAIELRRDGGRQVTLARIDRLELRSQEEGRVTEASAAGAVENVDFDLSVRREGARAPATRDSAAIELEGHVAGARITGQGSSRTEGGARSGTLRLQAEAPHLEVFARAAQRELPRLGPVRATALLEMAEDRLGISDLDLRVGSEDTAWLHLTGYAKDLRSRRRFALRAEFGFDDVRSLGPLVGDPPDIGAVAGRLSVSDLDDTPGVDEFHLEGGRTGVFEIDAQGRFEDVKAVHGLDARVDLRVRDLAVVGELLRRPLPAIGPVEFSGKVSAERGELASRDVRARLDRTRFRGALSGRFAPGGRPRLALHVDVPELHLDDVGIEPRDPAEASTSAQRQAQSASARVFSDTPLGFGRLAVADVQASLHADRVLGVGGPLLRDVQLDASLKEGWLSARHIGYHIAGGLVQGQLDLDSRASPPTLDLDAHARGMDLGRLVEQIDGDKAYSGSLAARLDLHSRGASTRALASHLEGEVILSAGKGTIAVDHAGLLTRDLSRAVREAVARHPARVEQMNCLIGDFELRAGVARARTLVLDTRSVTVVGEGSIDLGAETVQLRLLPRPRQAGPVSTAATVQVTGPLTRPSVEIETGSLVTSSAKALLKNVGGATRLRRASRWLRGKPAEPTLCEKLLEHAP
jgi:hypothetical protein